MSTPTTKVEQQIRTVELEHLEEFRFRIDFGQGDQDLVADEAPPLGAGSGPEASRLLAAAIGNCLSASLYLCLQKSRVAVEALQTSVTLTIARNEQGRLRVGRGDVRITLKTAESAGKVERCLGMFEDYCTVTATLRNAFPVDVVVSDESGRELHASAKQ